MKTLQRLDTYSFLTWMCAAALQIGHRYSIWKSVAHTHVRNLQVSKNSIRCIFLRLDAMEEHYT
jgi:hypothetical protein